MCRVALCFVLKARVVTHPFPPPNTHARSRCPHTWPPPPPNACLRAAVSAQQVGVGVAVDPCSGEFMVMVDNIPIPGIVLPEPLDVRLRAHTSTQRGGAGAWGRWLAGERDGGG